MAIVLDEYGGVTDIITINDLIGLLVGDISDDELDDIVFCVNNGSSFKPLYYSAAIDSGKFTPASILSDTPTVFYTADGKPYIPQNFQGTWSGNVQLWYALSQSMNVVSVKILDSIGFDAAIDRAVALLGIPENEIEERGLARVYPLGLGVVGAWIGMIFDQVVRLVMNTTRFRQKKWLQIKV